MFETILPMVVGIILMIHFRTTIEPDAWWIGQFLGYLMRHNETVRQLLAAEENKIDLSSPVVGIHVRLAFLYTDLVAEICFCQR